MRFPAACVALHLLLEATLAAILQDLNGHYSQVFITPDSRYAVAVGTSAAPPSIAGIHVFNQTNDSWCAISHIPLLQLAESQPTELFIKMGSISNSIILVSLDSTGYVLQFNQSKQIFEMVMTRFTDILENGLQGWRIYNNTLVALRWDPSSNWSDMKLDYYHIRPSVGPNITALNFTLIRSELAPRNNLGSTSYSLWTDDRFIVQSNSPDLFVARAADSPNVQVIQSDPSILVGLATKLSYISAAAKDLQLLHLVQNSLTGDAVINTMNSVLLFRAKVNLHDTEAMSIDAPAAGHFAAQLAFEGNLLAVTFEPACTSHTYLLLYSVNETDIHAIAYKQVHYTNGDWSRQGDVFYLTDHWLTLRGSPSSPAYAMHSIANASSVDFHWPAIGFEEADNFTAIFASGSLPILELCAGAENIMYIHETTTTGGYLIQMVQTDPVTWSRSLLQSRSFEGRPMACAVGNSTVVFHMADGTLFLCGLNLHTCLQTPAQAVAFAIYADVVVYSYIDPNSFPAVRFSRTMLSGDTLVAFNLSLQGPGRIYSVGGGDQLALCGSLRGGLMAVTIVYNGSTASQNAMLLGLPLVEYNGTILWEGIFSAVAITINKLQLAGQVLTCRGVDELLLQAAKDASLLSVVMSPPSALFLQHISTLGLNPLASWHQQYSFQPTFLVTSLRILDQMQDYVVIVDATFWKVLYYAKCYRCHRPRLAVPAFAVTTDFVFLFDQACLPLPFSGLASRWTQVLDADSWPIPRPLPAENAIEPCFPIPSTASTTIAPSVTSAADGIGSTSTSSATTAQPNSSTTSIVAPISSHSSSRGNDGTSSPSPTTASHNGSGTSASTVSSATPSPTTDKHLSSTADDTSTLQTSTLHSTPIQPVPKAKQASTQPDTSLIIALTLTVAVALILGCCLVYRLLYCKRSVAGGSYEFVKLQPGPASDNDGVKNDDTPLSPAWLVTSSDPIEADALRDPDQLEQELSRLDWTTSGLEEPVLAGHTLLQNAVALDQVESARILLEHGAWVDGVDEMGNTLLHIAASHDLQRMVIFLLSKSKDRKDDLHRQVNQTGDTFVHLAARCGCSSVIHAVGKYSREYLIMSSRDHQNIFHVCALEGNTEIIQLSLDYKTSALVAERDSDGMLPIDLANQCGRDECAGLLAQIWKGLLMPGETEDKLISRMGNGLRTRRFRALSKGVVPH